jgi:hypothetical protein
MNFLKQQHTYYRNVGELSYSLVAVNNWLGVTMYSEGPATGHHDTGYLSFSTACFSYCPPDLNSSE